MLLLRRAGAVVLAVVELALAAVVLLGMATGAHTQFDKGETSIGMVAVTLGLGAVCLVVLGIELAPRSPGADPADAVDPEADEGAGGARGREGGVRGHVALREPGEQLPCVLALLDRGVSAQDGVWVQERARVAWGGEGENDPRVALDVPQLGVPLHVAAEQVVAVALDPDDGDLRAAVGVDRAQVGQRPRVDEIAELGRKGAHRRIVAAGNPALGREMPTWNDAQLAAGEPAADVRALLVIGPLEAGRIVLAQERTQDERDEEDGDEEDRQDSHDAPPRV